MMQIVFVNDFLWAFVVIFFPVGRTNENGREIQSEPAYKNLGF